MFRSWLRKIKWRAAPIRIIVFVGAIMFPTILLGYLAIRTAETEKLIVWEKLKESYTSLASAVSDHLDDTLSSAENDFRDSVLGLRPDSDNASASTSSSTLTADDEASLQALQRTLQLESKHGVIGQVFFLNTSGEMVFPKDPQTEQQDKDKIQRFLKNYRRMISDEMRQMVPVGQDSRLTGSPQLVLHILRRDTYSSAGPYLVSYLPVKRADTMDKDKIALAGFEVDLDYLASEGLNKVLEGISIKDDVVLAILNSDDEIVISRGGISPPKVGVSTPPGKLITTVTSSSLPFWKVGVYLREPQSLAELSKRKVNLRIFVIALLFMAIAFGIYLILREARREAELVKLRADFVTNVSHELRTPLSSIQIFSETLKQGRAASRDKHEQYLDMIAGESGRLARLVDNVLDFSRLSKRSREFDFQLADVGEIATSAVEAYRFYAEQRGATIHLNIAPDLPMIWADSEAISQMVTNLVDNAVKYSEGEAEVAVNVFCRGNKMVIRVSDRGVGIDPKDIKRIFGKFNRGKAAVNLGTGGTGLGLTMAKAIAEAHGGDILVKSEVGVGSRFSVVLPLSREHCKAESN